MENSVFSEDNPIDQLDADLKSWVSQLPVFYETLWNCNIYALSLEF